MVLLTDVSGYAQFVTVLVVFVLVLGVTAFTTRWIADYQKKQNAGSNIEIMETVRLGSNKWIQIVRVGDTLKVLAVCKDTVTFLGEVPKEQLKEGKIPAGNLSFKELLEKTIKRDSGDPGEPKDKDT